MARFTVRVELHEIGHRKPTGEDYEGLHEVLKGRGYWRVIQADNGKWFVLPHATYDAEKNMTSVAVLNEVYPIIISVWSKAGVFVTESNGRAWQGLTEIPL
jgi:hypothetical protein